MAVLTIPGAGAGVDYDISPNPTADDVEFKLTTDAALFATVGTLNTKVSDTDLKSNLHIANTATGSFQVHGCWKAIPSMPFTVTIDVTDMKWDANYQHVGLLLVEGTGTGKFALFGPCHQLGTLMDAGYTVYSSRTARSAATDYGTDYRWPRFVRMIVTSSTSVTLQTSQEGHIWRTHGTVNPGFTIAGIGFCLSGEDNSVNCEAFINWMRFGTDVVWPESRLWQG